MKILYLLGFLPLLVLGQFRPEYRFDYEYYVQAKGWLKFHVIPSIWNEARLRCQAEGAVLASPLNAELKSAIISTVKSHKDGDVPPAIFTGVHATFSQGDYSTVEGVPLNRLPIRWAAGEPDNYLNSESCLYMTTEGFMADTRCDRVLPYVCYKKFTPLTITECGTSDPGYKLETKTGSCYKLHTTGLIWSQAYMTCIAEGGHLVVINNNDEAQVVQTVLAKHPDYTIYNSAYKSLFFIGIHDWGSRDANFMTIHGQTLESTYQNWLAGCPNNVTHPRTDEKGESTGSIYRNGQLEDYFSFVPLGFLCEKSPKSLLNYNSIE